MPARRCVDLTLERFGSVDILINNAGTNPAYGPLLEQDHARFAKIFDVNLWAPLMWTSLVVTAWMGEHGGAVVNTASIGGMHQSPAMGMYNATKAALIHVTKQLALELSPRIRVNAICPGVVRTRLAEALWKDHEDPLAATIALGRIGEPADIASAVSLRYCDSDVWVTDNALACRAKKPEETRYWYYALLGFGLNRYRAGSGQPLLSQGVLRNVSVSAVAAPDRPRIGEILGAFDDKIAANDRVIEAAEALMLAIVGRLSAYVPLSSLASRSTACLDAQHFDSTVAHYSFAAFDGGAQPSRVGGRTIRSAKLVVSQPCVLFPKLNPRIPRIWNITSLPSEMALASTEFVVLRPVGVDTSALWAALRQPDVLAELRQLVGGMTGSRQRIQPTQLLRVWVRDVRRLTPGHAAAIANLGALCNERRIESARLASCRDALLPLLMSGIDGLPAGR